MLLTLFSERRNFWKSHPDRDSMVTVLLQHIEDTSKLTGKSEPSSPRTNAGAGAGVGAGAAGGGPSFAPTPPPGSFRPSQIKRLSNYCGLKPFVREVFGALIDISTFYEVKGSDGCLWLSLLCR
jgi:hypothetical protein